MTMESGAGAAAWARAVALAAGHAAADDLAAGFLAEAGAALDARSVALADLTAGVCRAVWRCRTEDVAPLVRSGGPLAEALARAEQWPRRPVVYTPGARRAEGTAEGGLLVAPLRLDGALGGALLFFFRGPVPAEDADLDTAAAFAGVLALALRNRDLADQVHTARQSRDHFLTALHHELRTPATALMLDAGILQAGVHGALPERMTHALQRVETHASELVQVAGRVLDLAWLEAGEAPARSDLVDARQQVVELLRAVEPTTKRKGLRLALFVPRTLPVLQTDRERFARIFLHLVSNAVKYTDEGGIEVRLERRTETAPSGRKEGFLAVRVADTGRGIPIGETERVFEPFAQVDEGARTDSASRGVGLGLSLARKLARSLGGDVRIERAGEEGTTVTLLLPLGSAAAD